MSKICLTLTGKNIRENQDLMTRYDSYIDLAEFRVDLLAAYNPEDIRNFAQEQSKPLILTYRKEIDGGRWTGEEALRRSRLLALLEPGLWDYIDLEEDCHWPQGVEKAAHCGTRVIRSVHDFDGLPQDWVSRLKGLKGDLKKGAFYPKTYSELARFYREARELDGDNYILLAMGDLGFSTRVLAERLGSYLTFTSGGATKGAPGQIDPERLCTTYNFRSLTGTEGLRGIIGNPVMHTKSPELHNRGYLAQGLNLVYLPFPVEDKDDFFAFAQEMQFQGLSVTIPHKESVLSLLPEPLPEELRVIGACNTLYKNQGQWEGTNTDAPGFLRPLEACLSLKGRKAAVIGAGGAAKAVVYALIKGGSEVCIFNRTESKARALAEAMGCSYGSLSPDNYHQVRDFGEILVQTTSVGMHPMEDRNPLEGYGFEGAMLAYDIIYVPQKTLFLQEAEKAGVAILNGWSMLEEQAKEQYRLFTGRSYP